MIFRLEVTLLVIFIIIFAADVSASESFILNKDNTVTDTKTNLMWAGEDNGEDVNWDNAKSYCERYRDGGYSDWRMPTGSELATLYDESIQSEDGLKINPKITLTACCVWESEKSGMTASKFDFRNGTRDRDSQSSDFDLRALPVRNIK
jgi:hypothetical protein